MSIKDDWILLKDKNGYTKVYIYEIKPLILLDLSENTKENIVLQFKEFLRQVNFDFQILIINKKYEFDDYLEVIKQNNIINDKLYKNYILEMEEKFKMESIFETFFYIVISIKENSSLTVENVDNTLVILEKIGCKVNKINDAEKLCEILNYSINKEE